MGKWDNFYLSPEFWVLITPIVLVVLLFIMKCITMFWQWKNVRNINKIVKLFEYEEGQNMSMFKQVVADSNVNKTSEEAQNGNSDLRKSVIQGIYDNFSSQNTGLAQLISLVTLVESATREQKEVEKVVQDVKDHMVNQQGVYDEQTQQLVLSSLRNDPSGLKKLLQTANGDTADTETQPDESNHQETEDTVLANTNSLSEDQRKEKLEELKNSSERSDVAHLIPKYQCLKDIVVKHLNGRSNSVIITDYSLELLMELDEEIGKKLSTISQGNLDIPKLEKIKTFVNSVIECHN